MASTGSPGPGQLLIDGAWCDARSGKTFDTVNPADETVITRVAEAGEADVDAAVQAARRAFDAGAWSSMSPAERGKIL